MTARTVRRPPTTGRPEESWPEFQVFVTAAITDVRDRIARIKRELDERQKH